MLTDPVAVGDDMYFVQTTRALFKGQKLFVTNQPYVAVPVQAVRIAVAFPVAEPDGEYTVQVTPQWLTACAITAKTPPKASPSSLRLRRVSTAAVVWVLER